MAIFERESSVDVKLAAMHDAAALLPQPTERELPVLLIPAPKKKRKKKESTKTPPKKHKTPKKTKKTPNKKIALTREIKPLASKKKNPIPAKIE